MSEKRFGVYAGVAVLATVGVVVAVTALIRSQGDSVGTAITAVSTVVLVLVTACYVQLTAKLVQAQNDALGHARQAERARASEATKARHIQAAQRVRKASSPIVVHRGSIDDALATLRQPDGRVSAYSRATSELREHAMALQDFASDIHPVVPNLPPAVANQAWDATNVVMNVANQLLAFHVNYLQEKTQESNEQHDFSYQRMVTLWNDKQRALVLDAKQLRDCDTEVDQLKGNAFKQLQTRE